MTENQILIFVFFAPQKHEISIQLLLELMTLRHNGGGDDPPIECGDAINNMRLSAV